jgi:hypothetical protein
MAGRPLLIVTALFAVIALGAIEAADPLMTEEADAQAVPSAIVDEHVSDASGSPSVPATPFVPASSTGQSNSGLIETGDGLTTNLGGSDVAVSSVGGSYEIDGPKRKARRIPTPFPRP